MTNPLCNGVLFDLDGTLLDTALDLGAAANHALTQFGYPPITDEQASLYASHGSRGLLKAGLGDNFERTDIAPMKAALLAQYDSEISVFTQPYPGVSSLLQSLKRWQIPWGIVTNKPFALAEKLLKHQPALSDCQCLIGGDTLAVAKPHPQPLQLGATQIQRSCESIFYIGDAERDVVAANNAAMTSVAALWGYISEADNEQSWPAHFRCKDLKDLEQLIDNHRHS